MAITINNSANITYEYGTTTDTAVSNIATTMLAENYSLNGEKISQNSSFRPSENLTYIVRVINDGEAPLFGVLIQNDLGGITNRPLTYIEESAKMLKNGVLTDVIPTATEPLTMVIPGTLEAKEAVLFTYVAKVRSDIDSSITEIVNVATIVGHEESLTGPTITVTPAPSVTIPKAQYAEVRIEKSVDKENVSVGDILTYTFRLENSGNIEANNVIINDDLPVDFVVQTITSLTGGVETTFEETDYSIDIDNKLILPTSLTKTISVPASTPAGNGVTIVTIVGEII